MPDSPPEPSPGPVERGGTRFVVRPSSTVPGRFVILDTGTGALARNRTTGRPYKPLTADLAARKAARLNRNIVCPGCRHRRPEADVVAGRCPTCRGEGRLFLA